MLYIGNTDYMKWYTNKLLVTLVLSSCLLMDQANASSLYRCTWRASYDTIPYSVTAPPYPFIYTETQRDSQRLAGQAIQTALRNAVQRGDSQFVIPPGTYRLNGSRPLVIRNANNFKLIAHNVEMLLDEVPAEPVFVDNSANVTIEGPLIFDAEISYFTQGYIQNYNNGVVQVELMPGYPIASNKVPASDFFFSFTNAGVWISKVFEKYNNYQVVDSALRLVKVTVSPGLESQLVPGNLISLGLRDKTGIYMLNSSNCTFSDIHFYDSYVFLRGNGNTGNTKVSGCSATRRPGTNRLLGGAAGGNTYIGGNAVYENSEFAYCNDDVMNVRSGYLFPCFAQEAPDKLLVFSNSDERFKIGNDLLFMNYTTFSELGVGKIISLEALNDDSLVQAALNAQQVMGFRETPSWKVFRITLDNSILINGGLAVCENLTRKADSIIIRNCYFHDSPVRVMIQGFRHATIEANLFERLNLGLFLTTDTWWWEGSRWGTATIRNNRFINTPYMNWRGDAAAIYFAPTLKSKTNSPKSFYSDVVIEGNNISGSIGASIRVGNTENVLIQNNVIDIDEDGNSIYSENSQTVKILNNVDSSGAVLIARSTDCDSIIVDTSAVFSMLWHEDFENGTGHFTVANDSMSINTDTNFVYHGSRSLVINSNNPYATASLSDMSASQKIKIRFHYATKNYQKPDYFLVEFNDGSGWNTLSKIYVNGNNRENAVFYYTEIILDKSVFPFGSNDEIRFSSTLTGNKSVYLDDIAVESL